MYKTFSAMILAAGFGKRMHHLTQVIPKPLIQVGNVSLLKNNIDFLFKIGCTKIVINTHYKHNHIYSFIKQYYNSPNILISYEKNILDTAGGVKNAISLFDDKNIMVINSDIFLKPDNAKDVVNLINDFDIKDECRLLLVEKEIAHGIVNNVGDFSLKNEKITRWKTNDKILYYSGLQIITLDILNNFDSKKFSFNDVWDFQIAKNSLYGNLMSSHLYHVGDINGLQEVLNSNT